MIRKALSRGGKIFLSIVIPTRNRKKTLALCLNSLVRQTKLPDEILIVDNGSQDSTRSKALSYKDRLNIRYLKENKVGPTFARNRGIKESMGVIIAFLDDDCICNQYWVENILSLSRRYPRAVIQGESVNHLKNQSIPTLLFNYHYEKNLRLKLFSSLKDERQEGNGVRFIDTKNCAFPRDILGKNKILFDVKMPIYADDVDLALQVLDQNIPIIYSRKIKVRHPIERGPMKLLRDRFMAGWAISCLESKWHFARRRNSLKKEYLEAAEKRRRFRQTIEEDLLTETLRGKSEYIKILFKIELALEKLFYPFWIFLGQILGGLNRLPRYKLGTLVENRQ